MEAIEPPKTIIFKHFPLSSIPTCIFLPHVSEFPLVTVTRFLPVGILFPLRPALAPSVVTFSVPDLTYPPIKVGAAGDGM